MQTDLSNRLVDRHFWTPLLLLLPRKFMYRLFAPVGIVHQLTSSQEQMPECLM